MGTAGVRRHAVGRAIRGQAPAAAASSPDPEHAARLAESALHATATGLCGLDEVGRGAASGPLVAAAVVLPRGFRSRAGARLALVRDSKTLSAAQRAAADALIRALARRIAVEFVSVAEIDRFGLTWANREVFRRLVLRVPARRYVVDGRLRPPLPAPLAARLECRVAADASVLAVSAASIVAKVARDSHMAALARLHPGYGWERNAGYATREHRAALLALGPSPEHRTVFVRTILARAGDPLPETRAVAPAVARAGGPAAVRGSVPAATRHREAAADAGAATGRLSRPGRA